MGWCQAAEERLIAEAIAMSTSAAPVSAAAPPTASSAAAVVASPASSAAAGEPVLGTPLHQPDCRVIIAIIFLHAVNIGAVPPNVYVYVCVFVCVVFAMLTGDSPVEVALKTLRKDISLTVGGTCDFYFLTDVVLGLL